MTDAELDALVYWLREHEPISVHAADAIEQLRRERDEARAEVERLRHPEPSIQLGRPYYVEDPPNGEPFCACGRRWSDCDGSRVKCPKYGAEPGKAES